MDINKQPEASRIDAENLALHRENAELHLRLGQMTKQWQSQCGIAKQATAQLKPVGAGVAPYLHQITEPTDWDALTDEDRQRAFNCLPDMLDGFMKKWWWLHFAKAIEEECRRKNAQLQPQSVSALLERITELEAGRHQMQVLADALGRCILASGIVRKDIDGFTGPQLLHFANDLEESLKKDAPESVEKAIAQKPLKAGDTVHWSDVNSRNNELSSGKVTKVGSKLITVGNLVFRLDTLATNDEYRHQSLVLDVQAYQDKRRAQKLSVALSEHLFRNEINLPKLDRIAEMLGVVV